MDNHTDNIAVFFDGGQRIKQIGIFGDHTFDIDFNDSRTDAAQNTVLHAGSGQTDNDHGNDRAHAEAQGEERLPHGLQPAFQAEIANVEGEQEARCRAHIAIDDAVNQRGTFATFGNVPMRAVAVLYDNYNHIISTTDSGINTVADLNGRVVSTGAPGSGTEVSAFRILQAAGVNPDTDITKQSLSAAESVDAVKDDKIDAFFFSGGIPTGAILDLASTPGRTIKVIPNGETLSTLQNQYGSLVYHNSPIPESIYPGMESTVTVVAVSNVLVVHPDLDDALAYDITRVLFENNGELAAVHPMAEVLNLESATIGSPIPFHDGAIQYYRDRDAWSGSTP